MRVTGDQGSGFRDQTIAKFVIDRGMDDDPLHADAGLSRLVEGTKDNPFDGVIQVGVGVHDHSRVAPQFQHDLFLAGLGFQVPADAGRAGEGQQFQSVVGGEQVGAVAGRRQD